MTNQIEALTEWARSKPPEVVASRLKELDDALGTVLDRERDLEEALREVAAAFDAFYAAPDRLTGLGELLNRERIVRETIGG